VEDMALAIDWALHRSSTDGGQLLKINAGSNDWNYQISELAQIVAEMMPGVEVSVNSNAQPDKRSYRVDFSKFRELAPGFVPQKKIRETIVELSKGLAKIISLNKDFCESNLIRLKTLEMHINDGRLNKELRWMI
jgi:nucleoside-diphosphate-sugar epimerase